MSTPPEPDAARGQLLGFVDYRPAGPSVIPTCPFTAALIHRHPDEYADLVDPAMRGQFQRRGGT